MAKEPYPRQSDRQLADEMVAFWPQYTASCLICNRVVSVEPLAKDRQRDVTEHDKTNRRHLAFVQALGIDPEETE